MQRPIDVRITASLAILASSLWLGGMLTLGAIAAPVVFHVVPAPTSADAMTVVFRRFDLVAMSAAVVVLVAEALRGLGRQRMTKLDAARLTTAVAAAGLAIVEGTWLSPTIEALHRAGAVRGFGELGLELEAKHHLAELNGKAQALLLAGLIVMHVATAARGGDGE
jgi:uncharacterized membrane protein